MDAKISQLQQPQIHQIQQQQPQVQQPAQEQQHIPIPENINNENDSDNQIDIVFGIRRNITPHIPHRLSRDPIIYENNRSNFNRDQ